MKVFKTKKFTSRYCSVDQKMFIIEGKVGAVAEVVIPPEQSKIDIKRASIRFPMN